MLTFFVLFREDNFFLQAVYFRLRHTAVLWADLGNWVRGKGLLQFSLNVGRLYFLCLAGRIFSVKADMKLESKLVRCLTCPLDCPCILSPAWRIAVSFSAVSFFYEACTVRTVNLDDNFFFAKIAFCTVFCGRPLIFFCRLWG